MDKDNGDRGGLNMGHGGWVGLGRLMGENGDNYNWTTIKKIRRNKLYVKLQCHISP